MNTRIVSICLFVLGAVLFGLAASAAPARAEGALAALLRQTGLTYAPLEKKADVWTVPYDKAGGGTMTEYVTYSNDRDQFALIFVTVVDRPPHYVFSRALLTEAMKLNNDRVGVKFVLDEDHGDIDCQTEVYLPTATPASLKMALDNVAKNAETYDKELNGL